MRRKLQGCLSVATAVLIAHLSWIARPTTAHAYATWSDGCANALCHGDFNSGTYASKHDGTSWGTDLMSGHIGFMGSSACNICHQPPLGTPRTPVYIGLSAGITNYPPIACLGCHGRAQDAQGSSACVEGDTTTIDPGNCGMGAGLRAHHAQAGIADCGDCHVSDGTPVGENVQPPYYFADVNRPNKPIDACNAAPTPGNENKFGTTGLDNDGDGLYDGADPDCQAVAPTPTNTPTNTLPPPPTDTPTNTPMPTHTPSLAPTNTPTTPPTDTPTAIPPTDTPTMPPTDTPTAIPPTDTPTIPPTDTPTIPPTGTATVPPTDTPTIPAPPTDTPTIPAPPTDTPTIPAPPTDTPTIPAPPTDTPTTLALPTDTPTIPVPPTDTPTIPAPPTDTPTIPAPSTDTPTIPVPPTDTPTIPAAPTDTPTIPVPPTDTPTIPAPPTDTPTIPAPPTDTPTIPVPPTDTPTIPVPPTDTPTVQIPPTETPTIPAPTNTPTMAAPPTNTPRTALICHVPGGKLEKAKSIAVNSDALRAHLAHGDFFPDTSGSCQIGSRE
jgi:hypothetical protein